MPDKKARQTDSKNFAPATIHQLNNHLGVILGFVDLLLDDTPDGDPRRRDLLEIKQAAQAAVALVGPVYRPA
jgi:hypothetical protein